MDRRWYDGNDDGLNDLYHHHHHHWNDGGGLQARREARSKQKQQEQLLHGSSTTSSSAASVHYSPSPTSVTSLYSMPPQDDRSSSLYADKSLLGAGSSHHQERWLNPPTHHQQQDCLYRQDSSANLKPRALPSTISGSCGGASVPGVQMIMTTASSFDAVSRKISAFDSCNGSSSPQEARIEIAPGITERLRGAAETWQCIERDFYLPTQCCCCATDICCIMDATYVLCPQCKVISPLENGMAHGGGVGLGFTFEDLQNWQAEIILSRRR